MTNSEVFPILHGGLAATTKSEPAPNSDLALAIAAGKGDMGAFEKIYERHNRRVYSLCLRMTQNAAEAEDLAGGIHTVIPQDRQLPWRFCIHYMAAPVDGQPVSDALPETQCEDGENH